MPSFSELFSAENVQKIMADPRVQLGLSMMQAGGQQPGNPGFGERFAQAGQGFMGQQLAQQQLAARQLQMQQARQQQDQQQQLMQQLRDPAFAGQLTPHAARLAQAGASPEQIFGIYQMESRLAQQQAEIKSLQAYRQGRLEQQQPLIDARVAAAQRQGQGSPGGAPRAAGPKTPTPRQTLDEPLEGGMVQRHKYNPESGQYEKFGAPFQRGSGQGSPSAIDQILNGVPTAGADQAPVPGLPGQGNLQDYAQTMPQGADLLMRHPQAPMAAAGGGQHQMSASEYERDLADARRVLQLNPGAANEINRRLVAKHGRGL